MVECDINKTTYEVINMIGAIIGDTVGSVYEFNNVRTKDFKLFSKDSFLTDDSIMTLAVAEILQNKSIYDKDKIIDTFKKWGRAYPDRVYGGMFYKWLFTDMRESYRSFGNGAAIEYHLLDGMHIVKIK